MATTLSETARDAACNAVVDLLDGGSPGKLKILTSVDALLCTITLPNPAFGNSAVGIATANAISSANATAAGTAAKFQATNSADAVMWSGTVSVTGGGGDIQLTNVTIGDGDPIQISSWTHTQPAS